MRPPPKASGLLAVSESQQVHWEESGPSDGIPALYLHGGPGSGLGAGGYRDRFDERFRVVGIDQRGCGRSAPLTDSVDHDLDRNTTATLIADIEAVREHLGIEQWVLNGVSWGSTLALAYAQAHPHRVSGIVLMAVTTGRRAEIDWITEGVGQLFPEAWLDFARHALPEIDDHNLWSGERPRLVDRYAELLRDADPEVRDAASRAWARWEDVHVSLANGEVRPDPRWEDSTIRHTITTLVTHYWSHDAFCDPPILEQMSTLATIPGILIHSRQDVSGPSSTPWLLHQAWTGSELHIVEDEGHGGPAMVELWTAANSRLADRLTTSRAAPDTDPR